MIELQRRRCVYGLLPRENEQPVVHIVRSARLHQSAAIDELLKGGIHEADHSRQGVLSFKNGGETKFCV
jgi:hypothetical protein